MTKENKLQSNTDRDPWAFLFWIRGVDATMKLPFAEENPLKERSWLPL